MTLGMHKRGSFYDIVTVDQCVLVHPDCCKILRATLDYFTEHGAVFYKKMAHVGYLRHLLVRRGVKTGEILVDLVTSTQTEGTWKSEQNEEALLEGWKEKNFWDWIWKALLPESSTQKTTALRMWYRMTAR